MLARLLMRSLPALALTMWAAAPACANDDHDVRDRHRAYDHDQRDRHEAHDHYRRDLGEAQRHHYEDHAYDFYDSHN